MQALIPIIRNDGDDGNQSFYVSYFAYGGKFIPIWLKTKNGRVFLFVN